MVADSRTIAIAVGERWCGSGPGSTSCGRPHIGYERSAACECNPGSASDAAGAASCADCETVCAAMGFAD